VSVVELIKKAKIAEKKEKRNTVVIATVTVCTLIASGLIISQ